MAEVLALVDDLFFQAKMSETARHVGVTLQTVASGDALAAAIAKDAPRLVLVDLNARQGALQALQNLQAAGNTLPVIAFLSHVQTELAQQAAAAGAQRVLPRSKFTMEMAEMFRQAKS